MPSGRTDDQRAHGHPLPTDIALLVHSHLRWDFVWQRPQQLMSRFAATRPVLFVEEPIVASEPPALVLSSPMPNVTRVVPRLPQAIADDVDGALSVTSTLLKRTLVSPGFAGRFDRIVQWFYTPMPSSEMLGAFGELAVVYDCMDELSQFRFAPTDISRRERLLLSRADIVFTGGYRLWESKSRFHDDVHFFGCGVDVRHFGAARDLDAPRPEDVASLKRPVLGYIGVIDERLDYGLLRALARTRPDWTIVMIGPVVKVSPSELPAEPNIHWLGPRQYTELPRYLAAFDVCLMPFALNEATEYINPTKTLEYLATGRPVVSTPVPDVVRNFGSVVHVAENLGEFVAACASAIAVPDPARREAGLARAAASSWDAIVRRMEGLLADALVRRETAEPLVLDDKLLGASPEASGDAAR